MTVLTFLPLLGGAASSFVAGTPPPSKEVPSWVFAPVWTILYLMMGYASHIVYKKSGKVPFVYWIQLALNLMWLPLYKKDPRIAFKVIIALWVSILLTIIEFYKIDAFAGQLLIPYIYWVTYAIKISR